MADFAIGNRLLEPLCLGAVALLSATAWWDQTLVPLHVNITVFSLAIIVVGSYRSLGQMLVEMKKAHIDRTGDSEIETVSSKDALQFPLFAGAMLCGLYALIKFFGKDVVNYIILVYLAIGGASGMKALLQSLTGGALAELDAHPIISFKFKTWVDIQITSLDLVGLLMSLVSVGFYVWSKSWIYNNILAIVFCVHALQFIFLGNFKTGALLLSLLFFYDIFFVFGTDVMLTVAKNIDAPIKLQFPRDLAADPPVYSILGLGDIVIPGIFMSLCLRFDALKRLSIQRCEDMIEGERKGKLDNGSFMRYVINTASDAPKHYFLAVVIGYLVAIVTTVVIMFIFNHGQPALLYLVPGCILAVLICALVKGELKEVISFAEEKYYGQQEKKEQ